MTTKAKTKLLLVTSKPKQCDLKEYSVRSIYCPVEGKMVTAYGIPLDEIQRDDLNPARPEGTDQGNVNSIYQKLITSPDGQEEPCSASWNASAGKWDLVYGWNRYDGFLRAQTDGMAIANSPNYEFWIVPFTGTTGERYRTQLKENANKKGGKESTANEVATMLTFLAVAGEMDNPGSPFKGCTDEEKRQRCLSIINQECPQWGGKKFSTVWKFLGNKNGATNTLGLKFKQWPNKYQLSQYFIAHNPDGITEQDVLNSVDTDKSHSGVDDKGDAYFKSGFHLEKNGVRYVFYIALNKSEACGALPCNASKSKIKSKADKIIVLVACNKAASSKIATTRQGFVKELKWWNQNIKHIFDKVYFIPQTSAEVSRQLLKGQWARQDTL